MLRSYTPFCNEIIDDDDDDDDIINIITKVQVPVALEANTIPVSNTHCFLLFTANTHL